MTQATIGINSFNGGEIGPKSEGRTDLEQYPASARQIKNMIPQVNGSLTRRPGTQHAAVALHSTIPSRLIPFQIGYGENYVLELNEYKMRIFKDDAPMYYQSRVFTGNEWTPSSKQFHLRYGHGFYHGQPVRFVAGAGNPDGAPAGHSLGTTYYIGLPSSVQLGGGQHATTEEYEFNNTDGYNTHGGLGTVHTARLASGPYGIEQQSSEYPWGNVEGGPWWAEAQTSPGSNTHTHFNSQRSYGSSFFASTDSRVQEIDTNYNIAAFPWHGLAFPLEEALAKTFICCPSLSALGVSVTPGAGAVGTTFTISPVNEADEIIFHHPYDRDEIWELTYSQSFDRLYFYHPEFPPHQLTRWNVGAFRFIPTVFTETPSAANQDSDKHLTFSSVREAFLNRAPFRGNMMEIEPETKSVAEFNVGDIGQTFTLDSGENPIQGRFGEKHIGRVLEVSNKTAASEMWVSYGFDSDFGTTLASAPNPHRFGATTGASKISITAHGYLDNQPVCVMDGGNGLPTGLAEMTPYWIINKGTNDFELSLTQGGSNVLSASNGGADNLVINLVHLAAVTSVLGGVTDGDARVGLWSSGQLPSPLMYGRNYRARSVGPNGDTILPVGAFYLEYYGGKRDGEIVTYTDGGIGETVIYWSHDDSSNVSRAHIKCHVSMGSTQGTPGHDPTYLWRKGQLGSVLGWPSVGAFHEQRHVMCRSNTFPNRVWMSKTGSELDFGATELIVLPSGGVDREPNVLPHDVLDTSGIAIDPVTSSTSGVVWAVGHNTLLVGTRTEIFEIFASSDRQAVTPSNINSRIVTSVGASVVRPVRAGTDVIYMTSSNKQVQAILFDGLSSASAPVDLTAISSQVTDSEIVDMAWQQEPYKTCWCVRGDGRLYGLTYDREQAVTGWHQHELGGTYGSDAFGHVKAVAVAPHKDPSNARGDYDRLWMSVFRTVESLPTQHIEFLTRGFEGWSEAKEAQFVDAAPAPYSGGATTTPWASTLNWIEGEELEVWADTGSGSRGEALANATVTAAGLLTVAENVVYAVAGLGYTSQWDSLPLDAVVDDETTIQALKKRIVDLFLRLDRSHAGTVGQDTLSQTSLGNLADGVNTPFTGLTKVRGLQHEWNEEATVTLKVTGPAPFHLNALIARIDWNAR